MTDILSLNFTELEKFITEDMHEPGFRAKQLYEWMHRHLAASYDDMKNIPKALKEKLRVETEYITLKPVEIQTSRIDGTRKYLFALPDGNMVESVLMHYNHGDSICISSQVGCRMGCRFCASTIDGWLRNLAPSEMLGQVYAIQRDVTASGGSRIDSIVVMGTGEPLDNYDNLLKFISMISDEHGMNISQRSITVSTCGLVPQIKRLEKENLQITLALSLHAPDQAKREELMPIARTYEIHEVVDAVKHYGETTGRRVTYEYSLVAGVNDSDEDARKLSTLLAGRTIPHVNLIPVNPIKERNYKAPSREAASAFSKKLEKSGINVTIRREMGRDIDGACGQLRRRHLSQ